MAQVIFLRGANVGGHKTFRPSAFAAELADLDVVNVGAAGTFVVRKSISQAKLRDELGQRLPFQAELMIFPGRDVLALASGDPFADTSAEDGVVRYVSALAKLPRTPPALSLSRPDGEEWLVKVIGLHDRFALSLNRRLGKKMLYPNEVVEKHFGVSATTRNWNTIAAICDILRGD
jgi:uncharacterized protein (DUF1697 family)